MAKGSRGGQRAGGTLSGTGNVNPSQQTQQPQQAQVDNTQTASDFSTDYNAFMAMSDDEKADVISKAVSQGVPDHLSQSDFQKFIYNSGLNDKPDVVDDATLNSMNGQELFRNVNHVKDTVHGLTYTADQIARQVMAGRVTRTSDNGGSAYGRGLYFATTYGSSAGYGRTIGDIKSTAVMRAKLNNNAKIISYSNAVNGCRKEIASGSKLGKTLAKCDNASAHSIYAMCKGYNVISDGYNDYMNILNRGALTMSSTIKPKSGNYRW